MIRSLFSVSIFIFFLMKGCFADPEPVRIIVGAERTDLYLSKILDKKVGLLVNPTSIAGGKHLVDFLLDHGVSVTKIFSPEHGFRGPSEAGEHTNNEVDEKTGIPIVSLYGKHRKPTPEMMEGLDIVIFDIQDVGARFYTYISSMHYMMEACAASGVKMLVLDRPNPNGHYVDGPVLEDAFKSFVGMHHVPIVHGMTVGEYALMINGERWLEDSLVCDLDVIGMEHYTHDSLYCLPVKPSPNLPNDQAIRLYPSICLFEGTKISLGRGTYTPFLVIGYPDSRFGTYEFTPRSIKGMAASPKCMDEVCYGKDLREAEVKSRIDLSYLIGFYKLWNKEEDFFIPYFNTLAGTSTLKEQIINGISEEEIRNSWQKDLNAFMKIRKKYLLYNDFTR